MMLTKDSSSVYVLIDVCVFTAVTDINECCIDNGGCSHQCINTFQSYKCACPDDMPILGADGKNCTREYGPSLRVYVAVRMWLLCDLEDIPTT